MRKVKCLFSFCILVCGLCLLYGWWLFFIQTFFIFFLFFFFLLLSLLAVVFPLADIKPFITHVSSPCAFVFLSTCSCLYEHHHHFFGERELLTSFWFLFFSCAFQQPFSSCFPSQERERLDCLYSYTVGINSLFKLYELLFAQCLI